MAIYSASVIVRSRWAILKFAFDGPDPIIYGKWVMTADTGGSVSEFAEGFDMRSYARLDGQMLVGERSPRRPGIFPEIMIKASIDSPFSSAVLAVKQSPDELLGVLVRVGTWEYTFSSESEEVLVPLSSSEASAGEIDPKKVSEFVRRIDPQAILARSRAECEFSASRKPD